MLYTREEILMESTIVSDMERIDVMSSMMLENFLDDMWNAETEEAFTEASGNAKNTLKTMVTTTIKKIKDFIKKTVDSLKEKIRKHKLKRMMSPEFKEMIKKLKAGELKGKKVKDIGKLVEIVGKSEKFIRSFDDKVASYFTDLMNAKSVEEQQRVGKSIAKFIESSVVAYEKIVNEAANVPEVELTVDRIYKFVEYGINSMEDLEKLNTTLDLLEKQFQNVLRYYDAAIENIVRESVESVEDEYEMMESVGSVLQSIKSTISRALNAVSKFVAKHSKIIILISAALIYIGGNVWMHNMRSGNEALQKYTDEYGKISDYNSKVYDDFKKEHDGKPWKEWKAGFEKMKSNQKSYDSIKDIKDKSDAFYQKASIGGAMVVAGAKGIIGTTRVKKHEDKKAREEAEKKKDEYNESVNPDILLERAFTPDGIDGKIKKIDGLHHVSGCTEAQLKNAEEELGLKFPKEFANYMRKYGAISFYGTEWTGLNVSGHLNVVEATMQERKMNSSFPEDCFVIENQGIGGLVTVGSTSGKIFYMEHGKKKPACDSLSKYLDICCQRSQENQKKPHYTDRTHPNAKKKK